MTVDADAFYGALVGVLWVALAAALGVVALAALALGGRAVSTRLERRYLPRLGRWSRRRAGLAPEAGPWACRACPSVNPPTAAACYACGGARPSGAPELADVATDPAIFHPARPASRFDPTLYRGPGAPPDAPPADAGAPPKAGTSPPDDGPGSAGDRP